MAKPSAGDPLSQGHTSDHDRWVDPIAHFSAVGDGVADDSGPLTNAIAAMNSSASGGLFLQPNKTFKVNSQVILNTNYARVYGHGATIKTASGAAISGLAIKGNANTIEGLRIDQTGNASMTSGFDLYGNGAGQGGGSHVLDSCSVVGTGPFAADFAPYRVRNNPATPSDNTTGAYWNRFRSCHTQLASGVTKFPFGIVLEGGANATVVDSCQLSSAVVGVTVRTQSGDTTGTLPNSTVIFGTAFEAVTDAVVLSTTVAGSNIAGLDITHNRFETIGGFILKFSKSGAGSYTNSVPVFLGMNHYSGSPAGGYISNPDGFTVNALDPSITPALGTGSMSLWTNVTPLTTQNVSLTGALKVYSGATLIGTIDQTGSLFLFTDNGGNGVKFNTSRMGFFNHAVGTQPAAYTVTNPTTDRALNVTADTLPQVAQVLGTLIADLQSLGLLA
jgi:hypothetical protein